MAQVISAVTRVRRWQKQAIRLSAMTVSNVVMSGPVKWGPLEQGNILDKTRLEEVLKQYQPEAVMHFAGYISVEESVKAPALYQRNNV